MVHGCRDSNQRIIAHWLIVSPLAFRILYVEYHDFQLLPRAIRLQQHRGENESEVRANQGDLVWHVEAGTVKK